MINRKKKLKLIQLTLLILGIVVIFTTYYKSENVSTLQNNNKLVSEDNQNTVKNNSESGDVFFNIE